MLIANCQLLIQWLLFEWAKFAVVVKRQAEGAVDVEDALLLASILHQINLSTRRDEKTLDSLFGEAVGL